MSRDPVYDRVDYHGPTFKLLTEQETDRVRRKVKALQRIVRDPTRCSGPNSSRWS